MSARWTLVLHCALLMVAATLCGLAHACSPPPPKETYGFFRHHVQHLPKTARGVMFLAPTRHVRAADFEVTAASDRRPLALRVHVVGPQEVRLELVKGMQAGASYRFRYLKPHGDWQFPDQMTVTIDDVHVQVDGKFEITLAQQPKHRVIVAQSSDGSCVAPAVAVVQEFSYAIPASLLRYRDALDYSAAIRAFPQNREQLPFIVEWPLTEPVVYVAGGSSLDLGFTDRYSQRQNAVVAVCGTRQPRIQLRGTVWFPELDLRPYPTAPVEFHLNRNVDGPCTELDALIRTVDWRAPEPDLRELCQTGIALFNKTASADLDHWERSLDFLYGMYPTCNLVALAYLWRTEQFSTTPDTLRRLGKALDVGMGRAKPAQRHAAIYALSYLVDQLPAAKRSAMARHLLAPTQAALVRALVEPEPVRPEHIGKLLRMSGPLSAASRAELLERSKGNGEAAAQARLALRHGA